jgi:hypothetical protein
MAHQPFTPHKASQMPTRRHVHPIGPRAILWTCTIFSTRTLLWTGGLMLIWCGPPGCAPLAGGEPGFSVLAKAQPDEFYNGIGQPYIPLGEEPPGAIGQPKVNQAYVWSLAAVGDSFWFGTAANPVAAALGGITGIPIPLETSYNVNEYWRSKYPGVPPLFQIYLGDWRPPEIYRYHPSTGAVNVTPDDPLVAHTLGFRLAGATSGIVLLGGPSLYQVGINLFAFDAATGEYLGSRYLAEYSDIRRWVTVNGVSYTGTLNTWTTSGAGSILRWRGTRADPFAYEVVGSVDNEAATVCAHDGRLFALTWSTLSQTVEMITGARSQNPSAVWMSPPLPAGGLTKLDRQHWTKVWSIDQYEPDPVVVRSLWMGAAASHDGHLVWGTIQVPGYGAQVLKETYGWPTQPRELGPAIRNSFRPAALFRGRWNGQGQFQVDLLYGSPVLPVYTRQGSGGTWSWVPNRTGPPLLGQAGFDDPMNFYVWSMLVHQGRLWIGTMDISFILFGGSYTAGTPLWDTMGADLLVMDRTDQPAVAVSRTGVGNIANLGIRDMVSDGSSILLGTATAANLLTDPDDGLVDGGWELLRFQPTASRGPARRPRPTSSTVDWTPLLQTIGQVPP